MDVDRLCVYGTSDDLIELDGYYREEFNAYGSEKTVLAFSDGTLLNVRYNDDWRIDVKHKGPLFSSILRVEDNEDDEDCYSDRAFFLPGITWVVLGSDWRLVK